MPLTTPDGQQIWCQFVGRQALGGVGAPRWCIHAGGPLELTTLTGFSLLQTCGAQSTQRAAEAPDTDPIFDPKGDAARVKRETAERTQASLAKAAKAGAKKKPKKPAEEVSLLRHPLLPPSPRRNAWRADSRPVSRKCKTKQVAMVWPRKCRPASPLALYFKCKDPAGKLLKRLQFSLKQASIGLPAATSQKRTASVCGAAMLTRARAHNHLEA